MGLSASQARLLSITQRLSNNELESEIVSKNKMVLSARNTAASEKYISALESTKMEYISYNDTGIQEAVALSFNSLSSYTPLKNQYNLYNSQGQVLVSATDAANFTNSKSLYEFLNNYGIFVDYEGFLDKIDEYNNKLTLYETQMKKYEEDWAKYQDDLADYYEDLKKGNCYDIFVGIVGTSDAPTSCYSNALTSPLGGCYIHLLGYLINPESAKEYTTTAGDAIKVSSSDVSGSALAGDGKGVQLTAVREKMYEKDPETGEYIAKCDGDDDLSSLDTQENLLQKLIDAGESPNKFQILMSDYVYDSATNSATEIKSLHQKAVDMMYILKNKTEFNSMGLSAEVMKNLLINFTDGDMKNVADEPTFKGVLPPLPEKPSFYAEIDDKSLAQWYINLWYAMDGSEQPEELMTIYDDQANLDYYTVANVTPTSSIVEENGVPTYQANGYYAVIDQNLASDTNWLEFALNNGIVTMKQAALRTNGEITWAGIEFSSTSDIKEVEDSTLIAKAQAEYEQSIMAIQAEDKEYDAELKKLDTEHSALKAEVDSIKNVMSKNVEKSFSAFS